MGQKLQIEGSQQLDLLQHFQDWLQIINHNGCQILKTLNVGKCRIENNQLTELANKQWPQLTELKLYWNYFTANGVKNLLPMKMLKLKSFFLSSNIIGSYGIKWLIKLNLPVLQQIYLGRSDIGSQGAKNLMKANWPMLKKLYICCNKIGFDGYDNMREGNWDNKQLEIYNINRLIDQLFEQPISLISIVTSKSKNYEISNHILNKEMKATVKNVLENREIKVQWWYV